MFNLEKPLAFVYVRNCVLPSEIYSTSVLLRRTEFEQTWHESNTQHFELRLCFSDQLVSKDGALAFDWLRHFFTFPLQPLNIIWWNLIDLGPFFLLVNMHIIIYVWVGWLIDCFGFSAPCGTPGVSLECVLRIPSVS